MNLTDTEKIALDRDVARKGRPVVEQYLEALLRGCAPRYGDHPTLARLNAMRRDRYTAALAHVRHHTATANHQTYAPIPPAAA